MKVSPYAEPHIYLESRGVPLSATDGSELYVEHDDDDGLTPGAAIVMAAAMWFEEHWPAVAIGLAVGLLAVGIPALLVARLVS